MYSCPMLCIHNLIKCGIEYPKGKPMEKVREIRDDLEQKVTIAVIVFHSEPFQMD
jgi:hypothetical protein